MRRQQYHGHGNPGHWNLGQWTPRQLKSGQWNRWRCLAVFVLVTVAVLSLPATIATTTPTTAPAPPPPPSPAPAPPSMTSSAPGATAGGTSSASSSSTASSSDSTSPPQLTIQPFALIPSAESGTRSAPKKQKVPQPPDLNTILSDPKLLAREIANRNTKARPSPGTAKPEMTSEEFNSLSKEAQLDYLLKKRDEQIGKQTQDVLQAYKDKKTDMNSAYTQLMALTDTYGLPEQGKEVEKILLSYREAAKADQLGVVRDFVTANKPYGQLSQAEMALFSFNQDEFKKAKTEFIQSRNRLVQTSAGMFDDKGNIIQSYEVTGWESLRPDQKAFFGNDMKEFRTAQSDYARKAQLSDAELNYITARQTWVDEYAKLSQLKSQRAGEKDSGKRKALEDGIAAKQTLVDTAYNNYVGLQPDALAAAYTRRSDQLEKEIKDLDSQISGMDDGPQRRELERKLSADMADHAFIDRKAREFAGKLTFVERLNEFVTAYNEYSGLGQYSSLFISDKDLAKRRKEAEDAFCDTILLGGTNCWASKICEGSIDATIGGTGIVGSTVTGEPRGAARIQADKSQPAIIRNESTNTDTVQFLYHVEYFIQNINEEPLRYNLVFYATEGPTVRAFAKDKELAPGGTDSRLRVNAIVRYSGREYETVCVTFNPGITRFDRGVANEICTGIPSYGGGPTSIPGAIPTPTEQAGSEGAGGTSRGGATGGSGSGRQPQDFDGF